MALEKLILSCPNRFNIQALLSCVPQNVQQKHFREWCVAFELLYWSLSDFSHSHGRMERF
jgi:hypothetical protein